MQFRWLKTTEIFELLYGVLEYEDEFLVYLKSKFILGPLPGTTNP